MAMSAIDEALRNITAVGGDITQTALLDNFAWGNTTIPDRLGDLVRASVGCYDGAVGFGTPFISGKDSLRNEFHYGDSVIRIPATLLISAVGIIEDVTKAVTMDFKNHGNVIMIVGQTKDELGGSHYYDIHGHIGANVPTVDTKSAKASMTAIHKAMQKGLIRSCHDCSEGGIGVAVAEMAFAGGYGASVDLTSVPVDAPLADDHVLFSESNSRFIIEVADEHVDALCKMLKGVDYAAIGLTIDDPRLVVKGQDGTVVNEDIYALKEAWQAPLRSV
jgi:phosphoribosylformylglycinamidine synthase